MTTLTVLLVIGALIWAGVNKAIQEEKKPPNPHVVCKYCNEKGCVKLTTVHRKKGISGGKATGALMTGGVSMFATGLSRQQKITHMRCTNCGTEWDVE
jgi:DNA-directed RNA polymerase subunit RPC12/RpoP